MLNWVQFNNYSFRKGSVPGSGDLEITGEGDKEAGNSSNVIIECLLLVCAEGEALWSHRTLLAAVSPVLHNLLLNSLNDDVVTLVLPQLRRVHLKLVLDYVYSGSMYLRAAQMQYVIGVIEVCLSWH